MKFILTLLSVFLITSPVWGADPASWDLLDEDCADISDWADGDTDTAVSEVDPAGQFRFDTNSGAAGNAYARRSRDIGSYPNTFTVEIQVYHDDIGSLADNDYFALNCRQVDEMLYVYFASDGIYVSDTDSGSTEVGTDLVKEGVSAEWQTWRFLVTFGAVGDGTCDVYLNDSTHIWEKVGTAIPCSYEGAWTEGDTKLTQYGNTTDDMVTHIDLVKIADGLFTPSTGVVPQIIITEMTW